MKNLSKPSYSAAAATLAGTNPSGADGGGTTNEDAFCCDDSLGLFLVADGMGGYGHASEASQLVANTVREFILTQQSATNGAAAGVLKETLQALLKQAFDQANLKLCKLINERGTRMGSTATVALIRDQRLFAAHVGDARLYLIGRDFTLRQLTRDHRLPGSGSNLLERCLGQSLTIPVDICVEDLPACFAVLVCCDGVWTSVPDEVMAGIVRRTLCDEVARTLIDYAVNEGKSTDDVTAVYVESSAMTQLKRRLEIEEKERAPDLTPKTLEEILQYYLDQEMCEKLLHHWPRYLDTVIVRCQQHKNPLLMDLLAFFRRTNSDEFHQVLPKLWKLNCLPDEYLSDLANDLVAQEDTSEYAMSIYERNLKKNENHLLPAVVYAVGLIERDERNAAKEIITRVFARKPAPEAAETGKILRDLLRRKIPGEGPAIFIDWATRVRLPDIAEDLQALSYAIITQHRSWLPSLEEWLRRVTDGYPEDSSEREVADQCLNEINKGKEIIQLRAQVAQLQASMGRETRELQTRLAKMASERDAFERQNQGLQQDLQRAKDRLIDKQVECARWQRECERWKQTVRSESSPRHSNQDDLLTANTRREPPRRRVVILWIGYILVAALILLGCAWMAGIWPLCFLRDKAPQGTQANPRRNMEGGAPLQGTRQATVSANNLLVNTPTNAMGATSRPGQTPSPPRTTRPQVETRNR